MSDLKRELLYTLVNPTEALGRLKEIDQILKGRWQDLTRTEVETLRLATDLQFKLLAKVMPDQKAVEIAGKKDAPVRFVFETIEQ
jgi:hypothetical protein